MLSSGSLLLEGEIEGAMKYSKGKESVAVFLQQNWEIILNLNVTKFRKCAVPRIL